MIRFLNFIGRDTVKTFTLDTPQPVKDPHFLLFPVNGVLEVKKLDGLPLARKRLTVLNYKELKKVMHQSAS